MREPGAINGYIDTLEGRIDPTGKRNDVYGMTDGMLKELYKIMEGEG